MENLVLVVDDTSADRELLCALCETTGVPVVQAENGKAALSLYIANYASICAVISDYKMDREMSGEGLARAIRKYESENNLKRVPITIVTKGSSCVSKALENRLKEAGADLVLDFHCQYEKVLDLIKSYSQK